MKKIFILAMAALFATSINAEVIKDKKNGGLFGYKHVEQTTLNNGTTYLNCYNPGFDRCNVIAAATITFGTQTVELSIAILDAIDQVVTASINESNTKGKFIFGNTFFVKYRYNEENDNLHYEIYLIEEARAKGFNI